MGFLDSLFDGLDKMLGGDDPTVKKPDAPDFENYWKQYSGWMQNINDRNKGELANVRARLSAAGASPDQLMMQTEQLESQRKSEIASLEGGQTKRFLDEAFEIATGKRENPYSSALPGMEYDEVTTTGEEGPEGGAPSSTTTRTLKPGAATSMEEYFTKFYGATPDAQVSASDAARKRAKMAASGGSAAPAAGGSGPPASTVFGEQDETFWR